MLHADGSVPCFVHWGMQKLWNPNRARWLTSLEKFRMMGFPVTEDVATSFGCQLVRPTLDFKDPHGAIGNSMCVPNAAAMVLTAFLSVRLPEAELPILHFLLESS